MSSYPDDTADRFPPRLRSTGPSRSPRPGQGVGGIIALVISLIFGIVPPFLLSNEVGKLYGRRGQTPPVTALTGLRSFPGIFILVGPFIWFVRTNNALDEYWRSQGVTRSSLVRPGPAGSRGAEDQRRDPAPPDRTGRP